MKRKRRTHSADFKARVALEALKGVKAINQIAQEEGVLPVRASTWKKELQGKLPALFESGAKQRHDEVKAERDLARMGDYNHERIHQALDHAIPWQLYRPNSGLAQAARQR
ncbi:MAG: hypothetical protein EHM17_09230 [Verrucomicrobiaceae bacterium]|nr:MAG: hypothetical protein EHM17_09230 [Verrucomicrobiaceae bacterium]